MDNKESFLKHRVSDLSNMFKGLAELSDFLLEQKDFETAKKIYTEQNKVLDRIVNTTKPLVPESVLKNIKDINNEELPECLNSLELVDAYKKLLSIKYATVNPDKMEDKIKFYKMSIEYNWAEEIPYLGIAKTLYENNHLEEALRLCNYILEITTTAPVYKLMGDIYRKYGEYGSAIENYIKYTDMNDGDDEAFEILSELYEEAIE